MSQLGIQNISHHYDNHPIFKDITLSLKQGEMLAILGASGSGKTTLLRAHWQALSIHNEEASPSAIKL